MAAVDAEFDNGVGVHTVPADRVFGRGQAIQQTKSTYTTAVSVQKPRKIEDVDRRLQQEAALAGEDFYYGWSVKDAKGKASRIEGPSVDLALSAARCYGNCALESLPVQDAGDSWIFTGAFVDLETGFTLTRQFRQSKKSVVHGRLDDERKDDVRFQIGQSKALRNVVINALPPSLIRHALEKAKEGVREKIEAYVAKNGLPAAVEICLKALLKCGVKESAVLSRLSIADAKAITLDHLVMLRGDLTAIESGREYADSLYPSEEPADAGAKPSLADKIKGKKADKGAELAKEPPKEESKPVEPAKADDPLATDSQHEEITMLCQRSGTFDKELDKLVRDVGAERLGKLTLAQATALIKVLDGLPAAREPGGEG